MQIMLSNQSRFSLFVLKGALFSSALFLYVTKVLELHHLFVCFICCELLMSSLLVAFIKKKIIGLELKYVVLESLFYILFWGFLILAHFKRVKYILSCLFLFIRLVLKLHFYCNCEESMDENDLEIFFKVSFFNFTEIFLGDSEYSKVDKLNPSGSGLSLGYWSDTY